MSHENGLIDEYFYWLVGLVCRKRDTRKSTYSRLFQALFLKPFNYVLEMDANRADDGIQLRYRFGIESGGVSEAIIARELDAYDCSMLEMMVALSLRCEEEVMDNDKFGNRTERWFWSMISSLGLLDMCNANFNEEKFDEVMERFISRKYSRTGSGGLFTIYGLKRNLCNVEIWYQAMWYLDWVLKKEGGY